MRNRIPLGCVFVMRYLQAFRFGYAPFRFAHFASVMLHFASLISHNLRCIPAYTHLIPTGFFQSSLNNHRDNFYIFFYAPTPSAQKKPCPFKKSPILHQENAAFIKNYIFLVQFSSFPALFQCNFSIFAQI